MGKHILLVSQYFFPESFRVNDIAIELKKRGHKVTVLTGIPNYPKGEYYLGYSKTKKREEAWEGIDIIRLPIEPRRKGSICLIRNYLSFVLEGRKWIKKTDLKVDCVFTYEVSPMTQALVGVWYSKKYKVPHLLYVTDLWPENVEIITGIHNKLFLGLLQKMVDYIYVNSCRILTSSRSFLSAIKKRRIPSERIEYWPQYAEDYYKPVGRVGNSEIPNDGILNVVFAGNIGYAQGLGLLPKAAQKLKADNYLVRFSIIGDGRYKSELTREIDERGVVAYFNMIERKPSEQIPQYLAAADALLITLSNSEVFSITVPAKTQSYLACGRPILVSANGEVADIIKGANAGLVSAAEDVDGFVVNIKYFLTLSNEKRKEMAINALKYSKKYFDKEMLLSRLDALFTNEIFSVTT